MEHRRHETALMSRYGAGVWANLNRKCLRRKAHDLQQLVLMIKPPNCREARIADMLDMTLLAAC